MLGQCAQNRGDLCKHRGVQAPGRRQPESPSQDSDELQGAAAALLAQTERIGTAMAQRSLEQTPEFDATDSELVALARDSCIANVSMALAAIRHGVAPSELEPPPAALAFARLMASRRVDPEAITRSYLVAQQHFVSGWLIPAVVRHVERPERQVEVITAALDISHSQLDRVLSRVTSEYVAARERLVRGDHARRAELVEEVLSSDAIDNERASRRLRYDLSGTHLGWVLWISPGMDMDRQSDHAQLESLAAELGRVMGSSSTLVLPRGEASAWGWSKVDLKQPMLDQRTLLASLSSSRPPAHLALGEATPGVAGFRASHAQALRAHSAVVASGTPAPSATRFADVALISLLLENPDAAREFVQQELGPLTDEARSNRRLRHTLRVFFDNNASPAQTARALGMHRNSGLYRLQRCEELLGTPISEHTLERHVALVLTEWLT